MDFVGRPIMERGIHGLPKISPGLAMADPSTPCGRATPKKAVFYPLGYPTPYGPVRRSGSSERLGVWHGMAWHGMAWHGMEYPWSTVSIARARHALPPFALRAVTPETARWLFQGWLPEGRMACGILTSPLDSPCYMGLRKEDELLFRVKATLVKKQERATGAKQFRRNQFSTSAELLFLFLFSKQLRCNQFST
jgi:hypothetical protein